MVWTSVHRVAHRVRHGLAVGRLDVVAKNDGLL
jgi:hypothetical protein